MKLTGVIILISSTTAVGLLLSEKMRDKVSVCDELISFCDTVSIELSYSAKPITQIIDSADIDFINKSMLVDVVKAKTVLSDKDNAKIGEFVYNLGKSDISAQQKCVLSFRQYIMESKENYKNQYTAKSKIYICSGVCSGIVLSLILV